MKKNGKGMDAAKAAKAEQEAIDRLKQALIDTILGWESKENAARNAPKFIKGLETKVKQSTETKA